MCKELGIGWKVNGTRVDDWPMFGVEEEPRNTVGEDDGAAILLVTDFKRLLRASNGEVVVGGGLFCLFVVEDVRLSEVGVIEIRRFLHCGTGVPSFSLSESISTHPSGGGRPANASSNIIFVDIIMNSRITYPHHNLRPLLHTEQGRDRSQSSCAFCA